MPERRKSDARSAEVLYLAQEGTLQPWYDDFVEAVGDRTRVRLLDESASFAPQVDGVRVVVDQGGSVGTRRMYDAAAAVGVELWQVLGTGLDHVDVEYILGRGMQVANTPGSFSAVALAEHALLLMLCFAKRLHLSEANLRAGVMYRPLTAELHGSRLLLVGIGASGQELARRAVAFGMTVTAVDPVPPPAHQLAELGVERCGRPDELAELLPDADWVSLHAPLTASTRGLLDAAALARMKSTAVLINVARGEIADEPALIAALEDGRIGGAGIDCFETEPLPPDHPFLHLPNVVATPHNAGSSYGTSVRRGSACAENVARVLAGRPPLHQVHGRLT